MISVIVPSRTDDFARLLLASLERSEPDSSSAVMFADNGLSEQFRGTWMAPQYCQVPLPFCFARAINMAVEKARPDTCDLLLLNDDAEMITEYWKTRAERLLASPTTTDFGIISFSIDGAGSNPLQHLRDIDRMLEPEARLSLVELDTTAAFVAVLIRRTVWNQVGPLDESFVGYGFDDDDYCRRVRKAGWRIAVTPRLVVKHGRDARSHSSSYIRYYGQRRWQEMYLENRQRFFDKWGMTKS